MSKHRDRRARAPERRRIRLAEGLDDPSRFLEFIDYDEIPLYRLPAAAAIAGLSYRQVDTWIRDGHVSLAQDAEGSGSRRLISPAQFMLLCQIQQLRALGIELRAAVRPHPQIRALVDETEIIGRLRELAELTPGGWIDKDGKVVVDP
jgi:hypothetical protein